MDDWRSIAALNNAELCDAVCRSHGAATRFATDAWTSPTRAPTYYPDAVTLVPNLSIPDLFSRIDVSRGCSIKDSFASLDLAAHGFHILFEAQWTACTTSDLPQGDPGASWEVVRDARSFERWVEACQPEHDRPDVLRAELLEHESIAVLEARVGGRVVAGAIANRSARAVGVSNLFAVEGVTTAVRCGCPALAGTLFGASTFVGYESGGDLCDALRDGFRTVGPLRVWIHGG